MGREVVELGRVFDGARLQARCVEERLTGSSSFSSSTPSVRLEFAGGGALAVAVERPERNVTEELVPPFLVQAEYLLSHRLVSRRQGSEMGYENRLEFNICLETDSVQQ
eukprot:5573784-Pleurochrysis_carterae.AAC.1